MEKLTLLIVDGEKSALNALRFGLSDDFQQVLTAASRTEALQLLQQNSPDLLVTELKLKDGSGLQILEYIQKHHPHIPVIILTNDGTVDTAVKAIRGGAYDYLQRPFKMADLRRLINRATETIRLRRENQRLRQQLTGIPGDLPMIGNSPAFQRVITFVKQVAPSQSTVLITGESGTGKEVVAAAIHRFSRRCDMPFIKLNCGAIPENLVESELFGYEKGAFTGAHKSKKGKFELANGGTMFLDEIGDLPKAMQVKLLRVLQEGEIERVGSTLTTRVDVRIIAATNTDLGEMVSRGDFREDLYYRLNVISITLPPLRERLEDLPLLAQHFIQKYNLLNQKSIEGLSPEVLRAMRHYPWDGNIRELENMIERAIVLSQDNLLKPEHFPELGSENQVSNANIGAEVGMSLNDIEKLAIERTLIHNQYDKNKTAAMLKIGLATLYRKIKEYGLATE